MIALQLVLIAAMLACAGVGGCIGWVARPLAPARPERRLPAVRVPLLGATLPPDDVDVPVDYWPAYLSPLGEMEACDG